jgi:hypothetical protein
VHGALVRNADPHRERITRSTSLLWKRSNDLAGMNELHVSSAAHSTLKRHVKVDDLELMIDKGATGFAILSTPFAICELRAAAFDQKSDTAVGKCIHHGCGAGARVMVELRSWSVDVPGMKKPAQPVISAI